jgi:hypothetical protein
VLGAQPPCSWLGRLVAEGPPKNKSTAPPYIYKTSDPPTHHLTFFFLGFFFKYVFGRFSARGVQEHHKNIFAKSPCRKKNPKKIGNKIDVSFCKNNRVEKFLQKVRPKIQNRLFLVFFFARFWAFLGKGSSKTR